MLKLQTKFFILGTICIFTVVAWLGVDVWSSKVKSEQTQILRKISTITHNHMQSDMMHDAIRGDVLSVVVGHQGQKQEIIEESIKELDKHYQEFKENLNSNRQENLPENIKEKFDAANITLEEYYLSAKETVNTVIQDRNYEKDMENFNAKFSQMEKDNEVISDLLKEWIQLVDTNSSKKSELSGLIVTILSAIGLIVAVAVPLYAWLGVFNPLKGISKAMRNLVDGNLTIDVTGVGRKDEIGEMASAVQVFKNNALDKVRLEEEQKIAEIKSQEEQKNALRAQEERISNELSGIIDACAAGDFTKRLDLGQKEGLLLTLSTGMNKVGEVCNTSISKIKDILQGVANGDLTKKMDGEYQGIFNVIQSSLNTTIDNLSNMVEQIKKSTESIQTASQEIATGSEDLSHRTEEQASSLEETAASMEELTAKVRQNKDSSREASRLFTESKEIASKGGEVVSGAVDSMRKIQDSSQKVAAIISTVDEIAFQTGLLALNAAVESARAGEAGKGFAVVAAEVRLLAGRSANASKEIKELISNSILQVNNGMDYVDRSGQSLQDIINSMNIVSEYINEIALASEEQSTGIEEVTMAISKMDQVTQQNAALVQENTAAAQSMAKQGDELSRLVSFFTINASNNFQNNLTNARTDFQNQKSTIKSEIKRKSTTSGKEENHTPQPTSNFDNNWAEF